MGETYIKVEGVWKYLYRVVNKQGKTVDFLLSAKRDMAAAKPACKPPEVKDRRFQPSRQPNGAAVTPVEPPLAL